MDKKDLRDIIDTGVRKVSSWLNRGIVDEVVMDMVDTIIERTQPHITYVSIKSMISGASQNLDVVYVGSDKEKAFVFNEESSRHGVITSLTVQEWTHDTLIREHYINNDDAREWKVKYDAVLDLERSIDLSKETIVADKARLRDLQLLLTKQ